MSEPVAHQNHGQSRIHQKPDVEEDESVDSEDFSVRSEDELPGDHNNKNKEGMDEGGVHIAVRETRQVKGLKILVLVVLVCAAAGVAAAVYLYTKNSENNAFEDQFAELSNKVFEAIGTSLDHTFGALDALSVAVMSAASESNQSFPFVTVPNFALHAAKLLANSAIIYVGFQSYVSPAQRLQWEAYSEKLGRQWIEETWKIQVTDELYSDFQIPTNYSVNNVIWSDYGNLPYNVTNRPFMPNWQVYPVFASGYYPYNWDYLNVPQAKGAFVCLERRTMVISEAFLLPNMDDPKDVELNKIWANWYAQYLPPGEEQLAPISNLIFPIFDAKDSVTTNTSKYPAVATFIGAFYWRNIIRNILPPGSNGVLVVVDNPCNPSFTYMLNGPEVEFIGRGDHHDPKYDKLGTVSSIYDLNKFGVRDSRYSGPKLDKEFCPFTFRMYPSVVMEDDYTTSKPVIYTIAAVCIFVFTSLIFILYDYSVERRQRIVLHSAAKSNAVVSSLFPATVRQRLYEENDPVGAKKNAKSFVTNDREQEVRPFSGSPIAELYTSTTVMFADIAGFTAWSSVRSPSEVFTLLETMYSSIDKIAKKRGVFKVETIGDSYVAVCGLPVPRKRHAVIMAKFAAECREKISEVTQELETSLGPGTADLAFRFGLNSGPTTAGVLRGDKSRFQLFGDTVNTAARMESSGLPNRIHASQKTADLLIKAGKADWLKPRSDLVQAKGKGTMQTYWVEPTSERELSVSESSLPTSTESEVSHDPNSKYNGHLTSYEKRKTSMDRLINWNTEALESLLKILVQQRKNSRPYKPMVGKNFSGSTPRDEISEVLMIQPTEPSAAIDPLCTANIELDDNVKDELKNLVTAIAFTYRDNPFHNFDHATHVLMATRKLLSRIVDRAATASRDEVADKQAHRCTYGITADPLVQFSLAFAALIHDVDHPGVTNTQLAKEKAPVAVAYNNKSVAEQNSLTVSWDLLMQPQYSNLRDCIYQDKEGERRFRQLLVNAVIATDIFDKELKDLRESRWSIAFPSDLDHKEQFSECSKVDMDRRATIVIEYIIQASDVSHCMQHWTVYQKWNKRLFDEMCVAYDNGRNEKNPADIWYQGELWFFDNYIIPLAQKLKECGVFGVSCDEFLDYAKDNRMEWEAKGQAIVHQWVENRLH